MSFSGRITAILPNPRVLAAVQWGQRGTRRPWGGVSSTTTVSKSFGRACSLGVTVHQRRRMGARRGSPLTSNWHPDSLRTPVFRPRPPMCSCPRFKTGRAHAATVTSTDNRSPMAWVVGQSPAHTAHASSSTRPVSAPNSANHADTVAPMSPHGTRTVRPSCRRSVTRYILTADTARGVLRGVMVRDPSFVIGVVSAPGLLDDVRLCRGSHWVMTSRGCCVRV
jgi:hypothetical protein